ncbi:MAG: hypothetical protein ACSHXB_07305 [Sulfitobacter sp.]
MDIDSDLKFDLAATVQEMDNLTRQFQEGQINAEEFESGMSDLVGEAQDVGAELAAIDSMKFGNAIAGIGGVATALGRCSPNSLNRVYSPPRKAGAEMANCYVG